MSEPGGAGQKIEWPMRLLVVSLLRSVATVIVYLIATSSCRGIGSATGRLWASCSRFSRPLC